VTFTIDTVPPQVTISSPANGSAAGGEVVTYAGTAGTAHGDAAAVTLEIFAGAAIGSQPPVQTHVVQAASGAWSVPVAGLGSGAYTARATQSDAAGNRGFSMPVTVTFPSPPPAPVPQPPSASFRWFPQTPTVGQSVAFVSNSTDLTSPINSFAWDLAGNGVFKAAGPVVTTTFTTPGPHTVHLRIGDARGATSVATATIPVSRVPLSLMQPFPIVRIAGTETATGVKLSQLAVQTPIGARVTVSCRGHGCHRRSQSQLARASRRRHTSSVVLVFPGFQRALRAGVVLEIRVAHSGEIGKYTRFLIRRRHIPARFDACLASFNPRPITCPS
jgi:PKD repeat protein